MTKKMNFNEFADAVKDEVRKYLPQTFKVATVEIQNVIKNNQLKLTGLVIRSIDNSIAPTIYLEQYYSRYLDGADIHSLIKDIANTRVKNEVTEVFDVTLITDFNKAKNKILPRLVGVEHNREFLETHPHKIIADLAVTYHISICHDKMESASTPITNQLMENWNVDLDIDTLHEIAVKNMQQLRPSTFDSMFSILQGTMGFMDDMAEDMLSSDNMMYVLSNKDRLHGATAILDPYIMAKVEEHLGPGFKICPSSIHELVIIPGSPDTDLNALKGIVKEVNDTQVSQEDLLSYNVYTWSKEEGLKIAC